mgnify:CR=1 FL=1
MIERHWERRSDSDRETSGASVMSTISSGSYLKIFENVFCLSLFWIRSPVLRTTEPSQYTK